MPNPANITIDLGDTTGSAAGHIACTTNAGFTQRAKVTVTGSDNHVVATGIFQGKGEKNTRTSLVGGGTVLSFEDAILPVTVNVSLSYDPNGTFEPNVPDKVIVSQLFDTPSAEAYQITSEDSIDNDFNDLIMTIIALKH